MSPDPEDAFEALTGEVYDAVHAIDPRVVDQEGHTTLDYIRFETPYMENDWHLIQKVLKAITPEQIEKLKAIRKIN